MKEPEFQFTLSTGTILRQPVNGSVVRHVKKDSWPDKRVLNLEFRQINRTDKDSLIATVLAARPVGTISITDAYGKDYDGIVKGDVTIKQNMFDKALPGCSDTSLYTVSFMFEGVVV